MRVRSSVLLFVLVALATQAAIAPATFAQPQPSAPDALALLALQQAQLTASDGAAGDAFGDSVAIFGDTAIVGAPYRGDTNQGAAYVFTRSGTTWSQQQKLTASDGAAGDNFGISVAVTGDTVLVGAFRQSVGGNLNQGSAYVFTRSGTTWSQQQKLTASDGAPYAQFGCAVALSGDAALVGANQPNAGGTMGKGAAYVFTRTGTSWSQQAQLTASNGAANDYFGVSVALFDDTALVGASERDTDGQQAKGAAYVFTRTGTSWSQQAQLTASDGGTKDYFGMSVAISDDTALIGTLCGGSLDQGSAYIFTRSGTTWSQQQKLTASDGAAGDDFAISVALSSDIALLGAQASDNGGQGAAYVFTRSGTTWSQQQKLTASDGAAKDYFGDSVAISGNTALVGVFRDQGAAYVFAPVLTYEITPSVVGGIDGHGTISPATAQTVEWHTTPTFTFAPDFGYHVGEVRVDGELASMTGPNQYTFPAVTAGHTISVTFAIDTFLVNVTPGAHGTITPGTGSVDYGSSPTYTITPDEGYHIASLTVDGASKTVQSSWTFAHVTTAHSIAATFAIDTYEITPSVVGGIDGYGTISPSTRQTAPYGATPKFTFAPDAGYHVGVVTVDGTTVPMTGTNEYTFPAVAANHAIRVAFAVNPKPTLGRPICRTSVRRGRQFTVYGTLKPHFPAGAKTVRVKAYRYASGKWRFYKTYTAVNGDYSTYTRYAASIKIWRKGKYRFKAFSAATAEWAATNSSFSTTLTVK